MIQDEDFTASSLDQSGAYQIMSAAAARLNFGGAPGTISGWNPDEHDNAWIQVQLGGMQSFPGSSRKGKMVSVMGLDTRRGSPNTRSCTLRWITPI